MSRSYGWVGKILWVNLTDRQIHTLETEAYGEQVIGGRGMAARIAWEAIPPGVRALDPENLLMVFTGPLSGTTAPFSGRTSISGLSPQGWPHEWYSRSNLGGHWGPSLKYAGYDGLVIQGKSETPLTLFITDDKVQFLDARSLWGLGTIDTQKALMAELGSDIRILTIGQAGENLSRIAIISTETESAAGQGGFGAVMGSKNLKAIAVRGLGPVYIARPQEFKERCTAVLEEARSGTRFSGAELDNQRVKKHKQRWQACTQQCGMRCGTGCRFYEVEGALSGEKVAGQFHCVSNFIPGIPNSFYDWSLDFESAFEIRHFTDNYGLNQWDLLLGIVPWLRSCQESGLIGEVNGRSIDFNDPVFWRDLLHSIAYRQGMGDALAEGGKRAPEILGLGEDLAHPLYAAWGSAGHWDGHGDRGNRIVYPFWLTTALQWAVDVRDPFSSSHSYTMMTMHWSPFLDEERGLGWDKIKAAGERVYGSPYAVDPLSDYEDKEKAAIWNGHRSMMIDSVPLDDNIFPMILSYNHPDGMAQAGEMWGPDIEYHLFSSATGSQMTRADFELACERGFNLERAIQVRNFLRHRRDDETVLPHFQYLEWWQNPLLGEKKRLEVEKFIPLLEAYYRGRGWDVESGRPTAHRLRQIGLPDVAEELILAGLIQEDVKEDVVWQQP